MVKAVAGVAVLCAMNASQISCAKLDADFQKFKPIAVSSTIVNVIHSNEDKEKIDGEDFEFVTEDSSSDDESSNEDTDEIGMHVHGIFSSTMLAMGAGVIIVGGASAVFLAKSKDEKDDESECEDEKSEDQEDKSKTRDEDDQFTK